jgi:predicted dehydrogenase
MDNRFIRWGILGTAQIARKNWKAIWNSKNGVLVAVASRELERSRRFIEECQAEAPFETLPKAFGNYEELIAAPNVDAVYIPLPTGIRKEWVERAAEAGKHIVCEKPCANSVSDLEQMIQNCRRSRVQFMDGVMFVHSQRLDRMSALLKDERTIGRIKRITSAFTFNVPEAFFQSNVRVQNELEPHGCLGDLGWYCIRFVLLAMDWKLPRAVTGTLLSEFKHPDSKLPVSSEFSGELFFDGGVSGSFYCSFLTGIEQWAVVTGTQGNLRVADFVLPCSGDELGFEVENPTYEVQGCDFDMQPNRQCFVVKEHSHSHPTSQETNLFRHFADQVLSGQLNDSWPDMALKTQRVMQACRESSAAKGRVVEIDASGGCC